MEKIPYNKMYFLVLLRINNTVYFKNVLLTRECYRLEPCEYENDGSYWWCKYFASKIRLSKKGGYKIDIAMSLLNSNPEKYSDGNYEIGNSHETLHTPTTDQEYLEYLIAHKDKYFWIREWVNGRIGRLLSNNDYLSISEELISSYGEELTESLTVYRKCSEGGEHFCSWTTDREFARSFENGTYENKLITTVVPAGVTVVDMNKYCDELPSVRMYKHQKEIIIPHSILTGLEIIDITNAYDFALAA